MSRMDFDLYSKAAVRTEAPPITALDNISGFSVSSVLDRYPLPVNPYTMVRTLHATMGLCTEVGELYEAWGHANKDPKKIDRTNLAEEIGDIFWYLALAYDAKLFTPPLPAQYALSTKPGAILRDLVIRTNRALDCSKKQVFYGKHPETLSAHLDAVYRSTMALVKAFGLDASTIMEVNLAKLRKRYPEKFTAENAINRDLEAEHKVLEGGR
jgi:hypothetical protein